MLCQPVYLGIGSNLGDRARHVQHALDHLGTLDQTRLVAVSAVIETAPVGPIEQGAYLNAAAAIETGLSPRELLGALHTIERAQGRDREQEARWGPRTLDLDILVYAELRIAEPGLTIPHPRLHERLFVLGPLAEIAPELIVPGRHQTVGELLAALVREESGARA
ncbi:2-amino-4-hydroxy-6-hydroxymethyldihydropteridinepyrophosphokinase [hydrothermal vent metagenome]|uniref:2-amino-4-hydroxy-6-hydroxymethyldihydropteridine diphosphokinase n=1 Tax=hydrothermal vent metagenome TaxID=652676 RepID=A0A3B1E1H0_9ZZZZ